VVFREPPRDGVPARDDVFFFLATLLATLLAAVFPPRDADRVPRALFGAALRVEPRLLADPLFGAALRVEPRLLALPRELLRALPFLRAEDREVFREPPRPAFLVRFATFNLRELQRVQVRGTCPRDIL
jgi:hypothetical protein